ncbi:RNA recognition motif domain-containing protein [Puia sp. P3]|uniref:RNA recognition motif domain-containing protein n=1 Tax=Puia sp. P3 TaxID=3423952 RepID=UPI003D6707FB
MYVSNLGFQVTEQELKSMFSKYGEVTSAKVITDRETGRSRGFAFVEMPDPAAETAMKELNGTQVDGRAISVTVARPKSDNGGGGGSFRGGGDRGGNRGNRW